jgi:hypothetical protein
MELGGPITVYRSVFLDDYKNDLCGVKNSTTTSTWIIGNDNDILVERNQRQVQVCFSFVFGIDRIISALFFCFHWNKCHLRVSEGFPRFCV